VVAGCSLAGETATPDDHAEDAASVPTNRIDTPASVRQNLGITFARVETRHVASTVRVPGRFERLPTARREYRTPLGGRIELLVKQYQHVEPGAVLYRLDSPAWRTMQREIEDAQALMHITQARLDALATTMEAHELHERGLREALELWQKRVLQLELVSEAGGGRASELTDARSSLNAARSAFGEVMEKHADLQLRKAELESELRATASRADLLLRSAASILGVSRSQVDASDSSTGSDAPLWKAMDRVDVRATADGVVDQLPISHGAWAEDGDLIVSVVDPDAIRFRAVGLQSDLAQLRNGLTATIVPPRGNESTSQKQIAGTLEIGLNANPDQRTIDLIVQPAERAEWTRAGVSAFLEIVLDQTQGAELAVPLSCIVRDGLKPVMFRRDPANPNQVIRIDADLGLDDGRWVAVLSGVVEGDEIVHDGAYQLMLASSSTSQRGGHFHADGTFHAEDD